MNRFLFYRRIRGPVFLLTFGVTALLAEWDVLGFDRSWPLYLIVFGVLRLAEGAAYAASPAPLYTPQGYGPTPYSAGPYAAPPQAQNYYPAGGATAPGTGLVPVAPAQIAPAQGYTVVPKEES